MQFYNYQFSRSRDNHSKVAMRHNYFFNDFKEDKQLFRNNYSKVAVRHNYFFIISKKGNDYFEIFLIFKQV